MSQPLEPADVLYGLLADVVHLSRNGQPVITESFLQDAAQALLRYREHKDAQVEPEIARYDIIELSEYIEATWGPEIPVSA